MAPASWSLSYFYEIYVQEKIIYVFCVERRTSKNLLILNTQTPLLKAGFVCLQIRILFAVSDRSNYFSSVSLLSFSKR